MTDTSGIVDVSKYLGDPSKADWVSQGIPLTYSGNVILTMPPNSVGTVLASTVYMWYGNVKARMKTSKDAGVVTAFILLSDVKDEIDYEWVGTELDIAQTNFYFQGIPNCKCCPYNLLTYALDTNGRQTITRATLLAFRIQTPTGTSTRSGGPPTRSSGTSMASLDARS